MKRILSFILMLILILVFSLNVFATTSGKTNSTNDIVDGGDWAFYIYRVDSKDSSEYNEKVRMELSQCDKNSNVSIVSESSSEVDFDNFISTCKNNYNAKHKVLIIVGKGEGVYGISLGDGKYLSLNEIRQGLSMNFETSKNSPPPLDIVMFDASLMSSVETGVMLKNYTKNLIAAESLMYDVNGFYLNLFTEFYKNTKVSINNLCKLILDIYARCVDDHLSRGEIITSNLVHSDVDKLYDVYESYKALAKNILKKMSSNNLMISHVSSIAKIALPLGETVDEYKHNLIDCFDFMTKLKKYFPVECSNVVKNLDGSIIYKVESPFMQVTYGVSIYYPMNTFVGFESLNNDYLTNIANSDFINGLYSFKINGFIDKELKTKLKKNGVNNIKDIDFNAVNDFVKIIPKASSHGLIDYKLTLTKKIKEVMQSAELLVFKREEEGFEYYNRDNYLTLDSSQNIHVSYGGNWKLFNGVPLKLDMLSDNDKFTEYSCAVLINDIPKQLYIVQEKGATKIVGVNEKLDRSNVFGTVVTQLKEGDKLTLVKNKLGKTVGTSSLEYSESFTYKSDIRVTTKILPDGDYSCCVVLEDLKGNLTQGAKMLFTVRDGKLEKVISENSLVS